MVQIRVEQIIEGSNIGLWRWKLRKNNDKGVWLAQSFCIFSGSYDANRSADSMKKIIEEIGGEVEIEYGELEIPSVKREKVFVKRIEVGNDFKFDIVR